MSLKQLWSVWDSSTKIFFRGCDQFVVKLKGV